MPIDPAVAVGAELPGRDLSWDSTDVLLYHLAVGATDLAGRPPAKMFHNPHDGPRTKHVVGVEIRQYFALRLAHPLVNGVALALMRLGLPLQAFAIRAQDVRSFIGRTAIDDSIVDVWIILPQNTIDGAANKLALIE